jgi:hypothetical protein
VHARRPQTIIVLDTDSSVSETHGVQEGSAYNEHFACTCYHPLFVFNQFGDLERCGLRPGNVHSAADWRDAGTRGGALSARDGAPVFPGGAPPTPIPPCMSSWKPGATYTGSGCPPNAVLQERIGWLLKRPVGRSPHAVRRYYACFSYRAASWNKARRVVAKVEWDPGQIFPTVGFILTKMTRPPERVATFYNQRGTAEQYIKEGKSTVTWTRLSSHRFAANAVRLQLHALAYNLANFLRTLALREAVSHWSMTTLRERLVKIGARSSGTDARSRSRWPR